MSATERKTAGHHYCHALECGRRVPSRMLMCRDHWMMVPPGIRDLVFRAYRPGQELDKRPSKAWLSAKDMAIATVAVKEQKRTPEWATEYLKRHAEPGAGA